MKHKINFKNIVWPKRYIAPYRAGPGLIFPTRVMALFIALQTIIGFMIGMLAIGYLKISRMLVKNLMVRNAKFQSVKIEELDVDRLHIEKRN
jgi:hypothetical protein